MQVKIHQRKVEKTNTALYKKAIDFFVNELIPKTKQEDLYISAVFKKFPPQYAHDFGGCEQIKKNPNRYKIEINILMPLEEVIQTLAHEIVHIKQGVMGKLLMRDKGFVWKGTLYKTVDIKKYNMYDDLEWENEARSLERELTQKFFKYLAKEV
jgi:hypothetical protein